MTRFRDGQEGESGTIRRDPARVRGRRDDQGAGEEAGSAPANGAPGDRQRDPTRAKEAGEGRTEVGSGERVHRPDVGLGSGGSSQAAAYGTSDLGAAARRAPGTRGGRGNGPAIRARAEART